MVVSSSLICLDGLGDCRGQLYGTHCADECHLHPVWRRFHDTERGGDADLGDRVGFLGDGLLVFQFCLALGKFFLFPGVLFLNGTFADSGLVLGDLPFFDHHVNALNLGIVLLLVGLFLLLNLLYLSIEQRADKLGYLTHRVGGSVEPLFSVGDALVVGFLVRVRDAVHVINLVFSHSVVNLYLGRCK